MECRRLGSAEEVIEPLARRRPRLVAERVAVVAPTARRARFFGALPETGPPLTLAESINRTLAELLAADPSVLVFGEDVGAKGGVYGVTRGLQRMAGADRVFDTLLDEQTILGLALGAGVSGMLPIPEIQYLAYVHNAIDQLRGEAATLSFFSTGQYVNPMVVRIAGYGYQKGFGGHFHNDNALGGLRDLPGVVVASPALGSDAAAMLRTCAAAAKIDGTVSLFVEPIALYHTRDLHTAGDDGWLAPYGAPGEWAGLHVPIGSGRLARDGTDVLIATWGNGLYLSLRVAERLRVEGISVRVLDLRWLVPLPVGDLLANASGGRSSRRRRRDAAPGWCRRGGRGVARRGRVRRPDQASRGQGLVRPARRCGEPGARLGGRHRRRRACDPPRVNAIDRRSGTGRRLCVTPLGTTSVARASVERAGRRLRTTTQQRRLIPRSTPLPPGAVR